MSFMQLVAGAILFSLPLFGAFSYELSEEQLNIKFEENNKHIDALTWASRENEKCFTFKFTKTTSPSVILFREKICFTTTSEADLIEDSLLNPKKSELTLKYNSSKELVMFGISVILKDDQSEAEDRKKIYYLGHAVQEKSIFKTFKKKLPPLETEIGLKIGVLQNGLTFAHEFKKGAPQAVLEAHSLSVLSPHIAPFALGAGVRVFHDLGENDRVELIGTSGVIIDLDAEESQKLIPYFSTMGGLSHKITQNLRLGANMGFQLYIPNDKNSSGKDLVFIPYIGAKVSWTFYREQ